MNYAYINKQAGKTRGVWAGGCSPRKFLEIRCSEVASGAIFGQKQSRSSYYFRLSYMHLLSQLTSNIISTTEGTKVGRTVGVVTAIEERLVNSRAPDIAIYFRTYLCGALAFIAAA